MKHTLRDNVINSFQLVKGDISRLQDDLCELSNIQDRHMGLIEKIQAEQRSIQSQNKEILEHLSALVGNKKQPSKKNHKEFVAAQDGKKFHVPACPFAKNILPKHKAVFGSKTKALNMGYKPCRCVQS